MGEGLQVALLLWASAAPLWALFWAIWTGRLRWMDGHTAEIAVTLLPASAASLTLMGVAGVVGHRWLFWLGAATFAVGIVLMIVEAIAEPGWLQRAGRHGRVFLLDHHVAFAQDEVAPGPR